MILHPTNLPSTKLGHTMIEMLVVMTVLGILATAAMPLVELTVTRNKERELKQALWEIRHAIDAYKKACDAGRTGRQPGASCYPPSLTVLVTGVPDLSEGGRTLFFLRRIPKDPFLTGAGPAQPQPIWGLRSYMSSDEHPAAGSDVFDVYSTSDQVGVNGIAYRRW